MSGAGDGTRVTLARKTLAIFVLASVILTGGLFLSARGIMYDGFRKIEQEIAFENVRRVVNAVNNELTALDLKFSDWSNWDDMYQYVDDRGMRFETSNFMPYSFKAGRFNLLAVLDTSGGFVFRRAVDIKSAKETAIPAAEWERLRSKAEAAYKASPDGMKGVYTFAGEPMLTAVKPILTTEGKGPANGLLIVGRFLNRDMIAKMAEEVELPISSLLPTGTGLTEWNRHAKESIKRGSSAYVHVAGPKAIHGHALIKDIDGTPALILSFRQERTIMAEARRSLSVLFLSMALIGASIIVIALLTLNNNVLAPLRNIIRDVAAVAERGDPALRISTKHENELGNLTDSINGMLAALERSQNALRESEEQLRLANEELERRVTERTRELEESNLKLKDEITVRITAEKELARHRDDLENLVAERTRALEDAQAQIVASERLIVMGQFAGTVAHEIRNPLAIISNSVYFLQNKIVTDDPKIRSYMERIRNQVNRTAEIIDNMMRLTRLGEPVRKQFDLIGALRDGHDAAKAPEYVNTVWSVPKRPYFINADIDQIKIAFKNVIRNAIQAMPTGGTLSISVKTETDETGDWAAIRFEDKGEGISPGEIDKIFQPLYTTKSYGMGFGLPIAKMVVDKHGGSIDVTSQQGKGTLFTIRLPLETTQTG